MRRPAVQPELSPFRAVDNFVENLASDDREGPPRLPAVGVVKYLL